MIFPGVGHLYVEYSPLSELAINSNNGIGGWRVSTIATPLYKSKFQMKL